jgi:hypothetical protein
MTDDEEQNIWNGRVFLHAGGMPMCRATAGRKD